MALSAEDIQSLPLSIGDRALTREAVKAFQLAQGGGPMAPVQSAPAEDRTHHEQASQGAPGTSSDSDGNVGALLHDLIAKPGSGTADSSKQRLDLDPQVYLRGSGEGAKPLNILDYVPMSVRDIGAPEEVDLGGGATLRLPTRTKPKLQAVSPAMWLAANARIMAALIDGGHLDLSSVKDYLAYTVKVGELACRYTWQSVLVYDTEYRTNQAAMRYRWGTDAPHLSMVALKEKQPQPLDKKRSGPAIDNTSGLQRRRGPSGREICLQFNSARGCSFGSKCNLEHLCLVCLGSHPKCDHKNPAPGATGQ